LSILALGDCNTLGDVYFENNSYPEKFARRVNLDVINCGYTMSTTREMLHFAKKYIKDSDIILIQYGLVDSWKTFKYAPYVLYYPDNLYRKIARKFVKKYKKIARKIGLNKLLGTKNVVPIEEYQANIEFLIKRYPNKIFILIDTPPNRDLSRNSEIKRYNSILEKISSIYKNCYHLKIYETFEKNLNNYYLDETHLNDQGYETIAKELQKTYKEYISL